MQALLRAVSILLVAFARIALATLLVFALVEILPGDPSDLALPETASSEERSRFREQHHLDQPVAVRALAFAQGVADGSFGYGYFKPQRAIREDIARALRPTLELTLATLLLAWPCGIAFGILATKKNFAWIERVLNTALALPALATGPILAWIFAVYLGLLPLVFDPHQRLLTVLLPALTLALPLSAVMGRNVLVILKQSDQDAVVRAARARGLSKGLARLRHGLYLESSTLLHIASAQLAALLTGTVVVERIFERPGLGTLITESFMRRDLPVVLASAVVIAMVYALVYASVDVLVLVLDPRARRVSSEPT